MSDPCECCCHKPPHLCDVDTWNCEHCISIQPLDPLNYYLCPKHKDIEEAKHCLNCDGPKLYKESSSVSQDTEEELSSCCKAKTYSSEHKYCTKYYCTKCENPCAIWLEDWAKEIINEFCYTDSDSDDYESWEIVGFDEDKNPHDLIKKIRTILLHREQQVRLRLIENLFNYIKNIVECPRKEVCSQHPTHDLEEAKVRMVESFQKEAA